MKKLKSYIILSLCVLSFPIFAQDRTIDSLKLELKNAKHDTTRCNILNAMIEAESDDAIWPKYNEQLKYIAETKLKSISASHPQYVIFKKYLAASLNNIGFMNQSQGNIYNALEYYSKSLKIQEEIGDESGIAISLNNIGLIYQNQGDIPKALENYSKSLDMQEHIGDKKGIAVALNNVGQIYRSQGDFQKALEYLGKCLKLLEELGDKNRIAQTLNNIGFCYRTQGNVAKSIEYINKSLKIREEIGDKRGISESLNNIGSHFQSQGDNIKALEYFIKSLNIKEEIADKKGIAISLNNIGGIYIIQTNYNKALEYCCKSMKISKEIGFPEHIRNAAKLLSQIYKATGNDKLALENYELYITMRDSINNQETKKASIKNQLKYEYEKQAAADSVKNAEEQKVKDAQLTAQRASLKQEKTQRYALYGGLLLVAGFLVFVFNRFRVTQKQKKVIEEQKVLVDLAYDKLHEKNKEVLDSIHYAKRIQTALLTSEKYIERNLNKLKKIK